MYDNMLIDAVIRNFEIIGEKEAAGFRDILIHNYFGIDIEADYRSLGI